MSIALSTTLALLMAQSIPAPQEGVQFEAFSGPAKLITFSDGVAIADYPSQQRCESAKKALLYMLGKENESNPPKYLPGGGAIYTPRLNVRAFCFPG